MDDLISRQPTIDMERIEIFRKKILPFMCNYLREANFEGDGENDAKLFADNFTAILDLAKKGLTLPPTEQRTGYWVKDGTFFNYYLKENRTVHACSECGFKIEGRWRNLPKYCEDCGTRMIGEKEDK